MPEVGPSVVDEAGEGGFVDGMTRTELDVAHEFAVALEQAAGVRQGGALEEADVHVGGEDVDVGEGDVAVTGDGAAVVKEFAELGAALAHMGEPGLGESHEFGGMLAEPGVDGGVVGKSAVEAEQGIGHGGEDSIRV